MIKTVVFDFSEVSLEMAMANPEEDNFSESESMDTAETNKEGPPKKLEVNLNYYSKKLILQYLKNENKYNFDEQMKKFRFSRTDIENFLDNRAKLSQMNVHLECDSLSFRSVNYWLDIFKEKGFNTTTENETAFMMKSIAMLEDHPDPSECGGINFQHLYQFIGNVMMGEPAVELEEPTRTFLCDIFGELINDANSEKGDKNLEKLQNILLFNGKHTNEGNKNEKSRTYKEDTFQLGLDPLNLSSITDNDLL